jgi:transposase-like protein
MKAAKNSSMTSTKNNNNPEKNSKPKRQPAPSYSATDKAQAVLAVWTERCKAVDVCRQLEINNVTFHHWQHRAMEGMLQALESRVNLAKGEVLSPRLQVLLHKRALNPNKLEKRLQQIQLARSNEEAPQQK